jgi:5-methylcytosine-specific restriction endonuclease McrA
MNFLLPVSFDDSNYIPQLSLVARLALQIGIPRDEFAALAFTLDEKYRTYVIERYDFLKAEKERNRARNSGKVVGVTKAPKNPVRAYDRLALVPLETVFGNLGKSIRVGEHSVPIKSKRYRCYARKGVRCVRCGIEGTTFAAERSLAQPTTKYHLNLYHISEGKEVMLTVDHIHPLSRGGPDKVSNLQPMCIHCNGAKGNRTEDELKAGVSHAEAQAAAEKLRLTVTTECDRVTT